MASPSEATPGGLWRSSALFFTGSIGHAGQEETGRVSPQRETKQWFHWRKIGTKKQRQPKAWEAVYTQKIRGRGFLDWWDEGEQGGKCHSSYWPHPCLHRHITKTHNALYTYKRGQSNSLHCHTVQCLLLCVSEIRPRLQPTQTSTSPESSVLLRQS